MAIAGRVAVWPSIMAARRKGASVKVKRIVSNVAASDVNRASAFYEDVLGLEVLMDLGWIRTYGSLSDDDSGQRDVRGRLWHGSSGYVNRSRRC
jgi:hypothetical protein